MKTQISDSKATLLALLLLSVVAGCGTTKTARLTAWRAAQYDVQGVERLAILGFRAPDDIASMVKDTTLGKLQQSRFYQVVQDVDSARYSAAYLPLPSEPGGLNQLVDRGRRLGVDAVLVGRVRKRMDKGKDFGNLTLQIGDPELSVMIEYYIVDVHTGAIRAKQSIVRSQTDERFADNERTTVRAVESMVKQCSEEMVSQITAGSEMIEVQLARVNLGKGSGYIQDGNKLAGEGKWREAAEEYLSAVEVNPDCHQAIYNIGLAAEAQGRFGEAEQMYKKAIKKSDEALYRQALARLEKTGGAYQIARQQIDRRPRWRFRPSDRVVQQRVGPPMGHPSRRVDAGAPEMRNSVPYHVARRNTRDPAARQGPQQAWDTISPVRQASSDVENQSSAYSHRGSLPAQNPPDSRQHRDQLDSRFPRGNDANRGEFQPW